MIRKLRSLLIQIPALLFLTWPLWYYGYPLLYSDSGTYLLAAHHGFVPIDRPVLYSLVIYPVQLLLGISWIPLFQAGLLILTVWFCVHRVWLKQAPFWYSSLILCILSLCTGLPHLLCQVMPDFFTAGLMLLVLAWASAGQLKIWEKWVMGILILFGVGIHTTHLLLVMSLLPVFLLLSQLWLKRGGRVWIRAWILIPAIFTIPLVNQWTDGRFYFSDSSRVFFLAGLQRAEVLEPYLERHCPDPVIPDFLCERSAELQGLPGNDLLWNSDFLTDSSCLSKGGWGYCWKCRNEELKPVMSAWWKDPETRRNWILFGLRSTWAQFIDYGIGMISRQGPGSAPYSVMETEWPDELRRYQKSEQFEQDLFFTVEKRIQQYCIPFAAVGMILTLLFAFKGRSGRKERSWLLFMILLILLANAAVCGTLSEVVDRYQARVIWLVPFLWLILVGERLTFHGKLRRQ